MLLRNLRKPKTSSQIPKILLIGLGSFGQNHLRILRELHNEKKLELVGVLSRDYKKTSNLVSKFDIRVFKTLTPALLKTIDAVDIVTPPESHFSIVKLCLKYTNVFVEKPLAESEKEARQLTQLAQKNKKILMVGHIFRYHPITEHLIKFCPPVKKPLKIEGTFINPRFLDQKRTAPLELPHLFDVVDFIWNQRPEVIWSETDKRVSKINIRYENLCDAHFRIGWKGEDKKRNIIISYQNKKIVADYISNTIKIKTKTSEKIYKCHISLEPLKKELINLCEVICGEKINEVDGNVGSRIVSLAERSIKNKRSFVPSVAVIGGGIFGTSIAAELGKFCKVTLFEKNTELLQEGSHINQFRHHMGYHYPRSDATVLDIKNSKKDFEQFYKRAIIKEGPTYYALARKKSLVNIKDFISFCKKHNLPYKKKFPSAQILSKKNVNFSIEVPEKNYHFPKLKQIVISRLNKLPKLKIKYKSIVTACTLTPEGKKNLSYIENDTNLREKNFDFVINATYANINKLADWLSFPIFPIRVDIAEVIIIKLPIRPISITIMDGPFATLMPTGNPNEFTLYHVKKSIIDRYVPKTGLVRKRREVKSQRLEIMKESAQFFPILKQAEIVESRVVHRGVQAYSEHDDSRVAELIEYGFGCWSVLSGKILSSVSVAKRLAQKINTLK